MRNIFGFDKPKTAIQWIIFLATIGITLTSPTGTRAFMRELKKYVGDKIGNSNKNVDLGKFFDKQQLSQALYQLKKRKILEIKRDKGKTLITLSEKGRIRKLEYDLNNPKISKPKTWDNKWRFVMFDIPESQKFAREAFRDRLKNLGFLQFQKSIWVYPYPCENEIDCIAENLKIASYITSLTVQIEDDYPLRKHFDL